MNPLDLGLTAAGRSNAPLRRSSSTLIQKKPPLPCSPCDGSLLLVCVWATEGLAGRTSASGTVPKSQTVWVSQYDFMVVTIQMYLQLTGNSDIVREETQHLAFFQQERKCVTQSRLSKETSLLHAHVSLL